MFSKSSQAIDINVDKTRPNITISMCYHRVKKHMVPGHLKQSKSEEVDRCDQPSNLTQIGFKSLIFQPHDLELRCVT